MSSLTKASLITWTLFLATKERQIIDKSFLKKNFQKNHWDVYVTSSGPLGRPAKASPPPPAAASTKGLLKAGSRICTAIPFCASLNLFKQLKNHDDDDATNDTIATSDCKIDSCEEKSKVDENDELDFSRFFCSINTRSYKIRKGLKKIAP